MTQLDRRTGLRTRVGQAFCMRALTVAMLAASLAACSEAGSEDAGPATVESAGTEAGTFCEAAAHLVSLLQPDQGAAPSETEAMIEAVVVWFEQAERSAPATLVTEIGAFASAYRAYFDALRDVDYDLDAIFATPQGEQLAIDASHSLTPDVVGYFESTCGLSFGDQAEPPPTSTAGAGSLEWTECVEPSLVGECATLAVPLDHTDPAGPTIDLALLRRRATTTRVGVLIVNPGGPGGSGVQFASDARDVFPSEFDVIGFDPRGIWRSQPIDCITDADQDANWHHRQLPDTVELEQWLAERERHMSRCLADDLAPHVGTTNVARDIEAIRVALGEEQINYLGFSYGGRIGFTYAALFPTHVRAMVLDAPQDPAASMAALIAGQAVAAQGQFDEFVSYCTNQPEGMCPDDPAATVREIMDRAETDPIPTSGGRPQLSGQMVVFGVIMGLLTPDLYAELGRALIDASVGYGDRLVDLAAIQTGRQPDGYADPSDVQEIVGCADHVERPTVQDFEQLTTVTSQSLTLFGPRYPGPMPYCWGIPPADDPTPMPTSAAIPPILVVSSTGDWPAPYEGAVHLTELLGDAMLLTRDGPGHTSYGRNLCIDQHVDHYLLALELPSEGTVCA